MLRIFFLFTLIYFSINSFVAIENTIPVLKWPTAFYLKATLSGNDIEGIISFESWVDNKSGRKVVSFEQDTNVQVTMDGKLYNIFYASSDKVLNKTLCGYKDDTSDFYVLPPEHLFTYRNRQIIGGQKMHVWVTHPMFKLIRTEMTLIGIERDGYIEPLNLIINGNLGILGESSFNNYLIVFSDFEARERVHKAFASSYIDKLSCVPENDLILRINTANLDSNQNQQLLPFYNIILKNQNGDKSDSENSAHIINEFTRVIKSKGLFDKLNNVIKNLQHMLQNVESNVANESLSLEDKVKNALKLFKYTTTGDTLVENWRGDANEHFRNIKKDDIEFPLVFSWGDDTLPDSYQNLLDQYSRGEYKIPATLDWRRGIDKLPRVYNQIFCGSCWSYTAVSTLEWQARVHKKIYPSFSESYLTGCSWSYNSGCLGGSLLPSYYWLSFNRGPVTSLSYGPQKLSTDKCKAAKTYWDRPLPLKKIAIGFRYATVEKLKFLLAAFGPFSVTVNSNAKRFVEYSGGIYYDPACASSQSAMDHALVIVGYGADETGNEYWIGQNSWGTSWGENGYIRISMINNVCGVLNMGVIPVV